MDDEKADLWNEFFSRLRARLGVAAAIFIGTLIFGLIGIISGVVLADGFLGGLERAGLVASGRIARTAVFSFAGISCGAGIFSGWVSGSGLPPSSAFRKTISAISYCVIFVYTHAFIGIWIGILFAGLASVGSIDKPGSHWAGSALVTLATTVELTFFIGLVSLALTPLVRGLVWGMNQAAQAAVAQGNLTKVEVIHQLHWLYLTIIYAALGLFVGLAMFLPMRAGYAVPLPEIETIIGSKSAVIWISGMLGFLEGSIMAGITIQLTSSR